MSELDLIFSRCTYKEPEETKFYSMVRRGSSYEIEKEGRSGYTCKLSRAGVFSILNAFSNVKYMEGNGCLRFNIEKDLLDKIDNKLNQQQAKIDKLTEMLKKCYDRGQIYEVQLYLKELKQERE